MTAPRPGAGVKVLLYPTEADYRQHVNAVEVVAVVTSDGPPGERAWWARVSVIDAPPAGRWLKIKPIPGSAPPRYWASEDTSPAR